MKDIFRTIGCKMIGWDKTILDQCGETSVRQYRMLLAAEIITILLSGLIGYCFADGRVNMDSQLYNATVAIAAMGVSFCLDRAVIMSQSKLIIFPRVLIAFSMAFIGTSVFGVIIFKKNVESVINTEIDKGTFETIATRMKSYDTDQRTLLIKMDSLAKANIRLEDSLKKQSDTLRQSKVAVKDLSAKSLVEQIDVTNKQMKVCVNQLNDYILQKELTSTEFGLQNKKTSLVEQLEALHTAMSRNKMVMIYQSALFLYLFIMYLYVLFVKMGLKKCDYDLKVENQQTDNKNNMGTTN